MQRDYRAIQLWNNVTPVAVTSSTDATPIVVTASAHGLVNGQRVLIFGHTTNIAANGTFRVASATTNTFALVDETTGANIAGSGAGAGSSGICLPAATVTYMKDYVNCILQIGTSGTATTTIKIDGSLGKPSARALDQAMPNFGATISPANPYSFIQAINLDSGAAVNGSTGIVVAGTDINASYEVNANLMTYLTLIPISWTQGAITAILLVSNNS